MSVGGKAPPLVGSWGRCATEPAIARTVLARAVQMNDHGRTGPW